MANIELDYKLDIALETIGILKGLRFQEFVSTTSPERKLQLDEEIQKLSDEEHKILIAKNPNSLIKKVFSEYSPIVKRYHESH